MNKSKSILNPKTPDDSLSSSTASSLSSSSSSSSKSVKFHEVQVREYAVSIGDNPSCSDGPPISLDWSYNENHNSFSLDTFESHREGNRRSKIEMRVPADVRHSTLKQWDVSMDEIVRAEKDVNIIRKQRNNTLNKIERQEKRKEFFDVLRGKSTLCYRQNVE